MKIKRIYIEKYKGLEDLEIFLDHDISILIWENWSGKSRILEFISEILIPNNNRLLLVKGNFQIEFDTWEIIDNHNWKEKTTTFPKIIGYYSWWNRQLESIFYKNDRYLLDKYLNWNRSTTEELWKNSFYFQPYFFSLALLHLLNEYRYGNQACSEYIRQIFWEKSLDDIFVQFQVTLQRQSWFDSSIKFWWAKWLLGEVIRVMVRNSKEMYDYLFENNFLDKKYDLTELEKNEIEYSVCKLIEKKWLIITFTNLEFLNFWEIEYPWFWFLEAFDLLSLSTTIKSTSLFIKNNNWIIIPDENLSEWERQEIAIKWITSYFNQGDDVIFLMDEPDVYLHPKWQHEFIPNLRKIQNPQNINSIELINKWDNSNNLVSNSHFILTTHSPLLVWSSNDIDIVWLKYSKENWTYIHCHTNPRLDNKRGDDIKIIDIYGNRAEFIYEEIFGLDTTRARSFDDKILRIYHLIQSEKRTNDEEKEYQEIIKLIKEKLSDDVDDEYLAFLTIKELSIILGSNEKIIKT